MWTVIKRDMTDGLFRSNARAIVFRDKNDVIHPEEVFARLYGGLEHAVKLNLRNKESRTIKAPSIRDEIYTDEASKIISGWLVKNGQNITAEITYDDGKSQTYTVKRRENFDAKRLMKIPNIVRLHDDNGGALVLREARKHPFDETVMMHAAKHISDFDKAASKQFYEENENPIRPANGKRAMLIPEPNLLSALQRIYNDGFPQITPKVKALDADGTRLWYVRDFLPAAIDTSLGAKALGAYFGSLHALGLFEPVDRQFIHYALQRGIIVNYDPDFICHTMNPQRVLHSELGDIRATLTTDADLRNNIPMDIGEYQKRLKARIHEVREVRTQEGYNPGTLFDHLLRKPSIEPFPVMDLAGRKYV